MNWKDLLGSISESANDELRLRIEYLTAENRILRQQISGRVRLPDRDRKELGEIGRQLGRKTLAEIATVAQPDTIIAWGRKLANQPVVTSKPPKSVGRPRVDREIEDLVIRMARENRSWGYDRIQGSLKDLGYLISDQTVGNILKRHGIPPAPERQKTLTWREFIRCHLTVLMATDFFNSELWSAFRLHLLCLISYIDVGRRHVRAIKRLWRQRVLETYSILIHVLNGQAQHKGRNSWIRRVTQSWAIWFGNAIPFNPISETPPGEERQHQSQPMANVVLLSAIYSRPIRAGPTVDCWRTTIERRHETDSPSDFMTPVMGLSGGNCLEVQG